MADEEGQQTSPLLSHAGEDAAWDQVEEAPPVRSGPSVRQLIESNPADVLRTLQRTGVQKVGEFELEDRLVLGRLGDDSIVTMGADRPDIDCEAAWRRELGAGPPAAAGVTRNGNGWTGTIPVLAYVVSVKDAAAPDRDGLLQPLLRRWQAGGASMDVFSLPAVQAVIDWKWTRFCKRLLLWELGFYLVWMFSFFIWAAAFQDEDADLSLTELWATRRGKLTIVMDATALLGMAPFLFIEGATIAAYGRGWISLWNATDCLTYALQIGIVVMHLGRARIDSSWLSVAAALQCILLLFRLQYFSRVFRATRFSFLDDLRDVVAAVRWYLFFILLIMLGFASAFQVTEDVRRRRTKSTACASELLVAALVQILYRQDQKAHQEYENIAKAFVHMVTWIAGNADLDPLYEHARNPVAGSILGVAYVFVLGMVLGNLLIGVMTNTLERVTKNEGLRMLLSKGVVIDEIESTLPRWVERLFPYFYPKYLHVLRVDPDRLDRVKAEELWGDKAGAGEDGEERGSGRGERRLEAQLDEVQAELREVKALLSALAGREE